MNVTVTHETSSVTVYEDRAEVTRSARVHLPTGASEITFAHLSPLIDEGRVVARVEHERGHGVDGRPAGAGHVDDVSVKRFYVTDGQDQIELRRRERALKREALSQKLLELRGPLAAAEAQRQRIEALIAAAKSSRARRVGHGDIDANTAQAEFNRLEKALVEADAAITAARKPLIEYEDEVNALDTFVEVGAGTEARRVTNVTLRVSIVAEGEVTVVLSTIVPCAAWRPTHEASLSRDDVSETGAEAGVVRFTGHGAVWNRTGEPWVNARITLSTARPSAGAELPGLSSDQLFVRTKSAEERKTIHVEHRSEEVPKDAVQGGAPGVDDGGEVRSFVVDKATILDDGRPHRLQLFTFEAKAAVQAVAIPEKASQVFVRASFKNAGTAPILAGAVALFDRATFVGTGDVLYCGVGDDLDLAFGSDDGLVVRYERYRKTDKKLVGKDVVNFVQKATISSTRRSAVSVLVLLRKPVSELSQLKVMHSAAHSTVVDPQEDEHGLVRVPVTVPPTSSSAGGDKSIELAFFFDTSGDVRVPDPW